MEKLDKMKFLELLYEMSSNDGNFPEVKNEGLVYRNMIRPKRLMARDIRNISYECNKLASFIAYYGEHKINYENKQLELVAYMLRCIAMFLHYNVYFEFLTTFDPENPDASKYAL